MALHEKLSILEESELILYKELDDKNINLKEECLPSDKEGESTLKYFSDIYQHIVFITYLFLSSHH